MWGPQLRQLVNIIIQGSMVYPNCISQYTNDTVTAVDYEIKIEQNTPLPEDELEERNMDLAEVESKAMSRKAYMKKWRGLTDDEVQEELEQIALERQIIEDSAFSSAGDQPPYPDMSNGFNTEESGEDKNSKEDYSMFDAKNEGNDDDFIDM